MSWCRHGGRDVPERPIKEYGKYERQDVEIVFENADPLPFTYNAAGRILSHFRKDGVRYLPERERDWDSGEVVD